MLCSVASPNMMSPRPRKYKAACDPCHRSKVKCPGGGPPCRRCSSNSESCHYSLANRTGKPLGSKNRKTIERLLQARQDEVQSSNNIDHDERSSVALNNINGNEEVTLGVVYERSEGGSQEELIHGCTIPDFSPLSSLWDDPSLSNESQSIPTTEHNAPDGKSGTCLEDSSNTVTRSGDIFPNLSSFENLSGVESHRPWAEFAFVNLNVSTFFKASCRLTNWQRRIRPEVLTRSSL